MEKTITTTITKRTTGEVVDNDLAVTTINDDDGVGAGTTTYTYYTGDGSTTDGWPAVDDWASFSNL